MQKLQIILDSIDWLFMAIILIGGRYWGIKYFTISKNPARNFLAFATAFGIVYLYLVFITRGLGKDEWVNLFVTFLFTTSFYEIIGQSLFERIESLFPAKKKV